MGSIVIKAAVLGATGYTGTLLSRLLHRHPEVEVVALTSQSHAGQGVQEVFPEQRIPGAYVPFRVEDADGWDVVFVCYPHREAQDVVPGLLDAGCRVIDLSADFRLKDPGAYPIWYGMEHTAPHLLEAAVYGLPEVHRTAIREADLVANPGCFPTGALLGMLPLLERDSASRVIVDSKSGVSGAGRRATAKTHFCNVHENFQAYAEIGHRHTAEMSQEATEVCGNEVTVVFTPHLLPVQRGILTTLYLDMTDPSGTGSTARELDRLYRERYRDEPFAEVVGHAPSLREVQGTNVCRICVRVDETAHVVKVITVIDNLIKGASGQAVQNMNIMFDLPEITGLEELA